MNLKLQLASLFTLGLLSGFVLAIILAISYFGGVISWPIMIGLTILFNLAMWRFAPFFSDWMYRWMYKATFYEFSQIQDKHWGKFVKKVCDKNKMPYPKIGIINDKNPTAFTYGSAAFNARIVLTEGIFHFLNEKEVEAVVAHEVGHIKNKDFIIMTIASTLLQLLYEAYIIFARFRHKSSGNKDSKGNQLMIIGYVSLVFYIVGTFIVLYLSRVREYLADEFAAKETGDANQLSSALIKIAYGIASTKNTEKDARLLNATRAQGIFDFKTAKDAGLMFASAKSEKGRIERSLLFDIVNPWAKLLELKSTHPLIGKRVEKLCTLTKSPAYNFDMINNAIIDKKRLWHNFFTDIVMDRLPAITAIISISLLIYEAAFTKIWIVPTIVISLIALILSAIFRLNYKYPTKEFPDAEISECMADIYASPVKGKPVKIHGAPIGRGIAGYVFGEDMIFQDKTGFIYLNFESMIPFFGNLMFGWKRLTQLLGKPASATGWFMRGATHHIELYNLKSGNETIKSSVRFWAAVSSIVGTLLIMIGIGVIGILLYSGII